MSLKSAFGVEGYDDPTDSISSFNISEEDKILAARIKKIDSWINERYQECPYIRVTTKTNKILYVYRETLLVEGNSFRYSGQKTSTKGVLYGIIRKELIYHTKSGKIVRIPIKKSERIYYPLEKWFDEKYKEIGGFLLPLEIRRKYLNNK